MLQAFLALHRGPPVSRQASRASALNFARATLDWGAVRRRAAVGLRARRKGAGARHAEFELRFLLAKEGAPLGMHAQLRYHGVTRLGKFSAVMASSEDVQTFSKESVGVDSATGLGERVQVAALACAWQAARARVEQRLKMDCERDARQMIRPLSVADHGATRQAFGAKYWMLEESQVPGRSYLEARRTDIERGDVRPETLAAV